VKKLNETQKDNLIDFIDAGMNGNETAAVTQLKTTNDVKALLDGIPEQELRDFQEQTEDIQEVLLTN
jgi:hypothetical protein